MKKIMILLAVIITPFVFAKNLEEETIIIPNESIRIRVIANSNSLSDQIEKNNIKNILQSYLDEKLKTSKSIEETDYIIKKNLNEIRTQVEKILKENNSINGVNVRYGKNFFPKKEYKGITYESGMYDSLVITIGEGKGNNWWCVLFPPLCLVDEDMEDQEYKLYIKEVIEKFK